MNFTETEAALSRNGNEVQDLDLSDLDSYGEEFIVSEDCFSSGDKIDAEDESKDVGDDCDCDSDIGGLEETEKNSNGEGNGDEEEDEDTEKDKRGNDGSVEYSRNENAAIDDEDWAPALATHEKAVVCNNGVDAPLIFLEETSAQKRGTTYRNKFACNKRKADSREPVRVRNVRQHRTIVERPISEKDSTLMHQEIHIEKINGEESNGKGGVCTITDSPISSLENDTCTEGKKRNEERESCLDIAKIDTFETA